jgi:hypothetical protein
MANEYLKRQPTSSGNSRRWTISFWMKNSDPTQGYTAIMGAGKVSPSNVYNEIFYNGSQTGLNLDNSSASDNYNITANPLLRDPSAWMHVVVSFTDQGDNANTRIKFYINGAFVDHNTGTALDVSETSFFNHVDYIHYIGSRAQQSAGTTTFDGQYFDVFLVDGQTLTADVFGFYKEGKGYQSSGSSDSTDFGPGQWSPHSPRKIKSEIERKGGFGVNGFYLPMNDSSNPGADFHCAPNSIIKLKGEDLPQPRNGAPTTSDAYVSQLRTDPFAANLVLAVPGISTATGANLVTNGTFDTNTTGWTSQDATLSVDNGRIKVLTTNTNYGSALQTVTGLTVGQRYTFQVDMFYGDAALVTAISGASPSINSGWQSADYVWRTSFTATTTSLVIDFQMASIANKYGFWDNVVLKQEDAPRDYSADIKGNGTNKTLTATGNAGVGYELGGYYGSAMSFDGTDDYFNITPSNFNDVDFGTGDFTVECWAYGTGSILAGPGPTNGSFLFSVGEGNDSLRVGSTVTAWRQQSAANAVKTGQWNHLSFSRENGIGNLFVNGVCVSTAANAYNYDLSPDNNYFIIGSRQGNSGTENPGFVPFNGQIQDVRIYKGLAKYKGGFDVPKPYTPVGIEPFRTTADTCSNNFATFNPLIGAGTASGDSLPVLKDGNLFLDNANQTQTQSSIGMSSGKWYCEYRLTISSVAAGGYYGVVGDVLAVKNNQNTYTSAGFGHIRPGTGSNSYTKNWTATSLTTESPALGLASGDIFGFALDLDSSPKNIKYFRNGSLIHTDSTIGESSHYHFLAIRTNDGFSGANWPDVYANFGQNPTFSGTVAAGTNTDGNGKGLFKYAPPTGFLALCEDNLPTPAIADPGKHFKSVLWSGDSNGGRSITGVGFQPDLVWVKRRDGSAVRHYLFDSVRGPLAALDSADTIAEVSSSTWLQSFDSNGFSLGTSGGLNGSGNNYVAWCWKAGGPAVSNSDGSITTQVSANPTAGFSIVKGTQTSGTTTFGHGLGKAPKMVITKQTNGTTGWYTYHKDIGSGNTLRLDNNSASTSFSHWVTDPTTSVFSMGSGFGVGEIYVAYCWAEIEGYSKIGSYVGNGNADGPFVYCGFKPAWVMVKNRSTTSDWRIYDSSRDSSNPNTLVIYPNLNIIDTVSSHPFDFLSNGFKVRGTFGDVNTNGHTYIFAAFAESPFQTANAK